MIFDELTALPSSRKLLRRLPYEVLPPRRRMTAVTASLAAYTQKNRRNILLKPTFTTISSLARRLNSSKKRANEGIFIGAWDVLGSLFTARNIPFDQEEAFARFQDAETGIFIYIYERRKVLKEGQRN